MKTTTGTWHGRAFQITRFACIQFVVLTGLAMLLYPGGSIADPTTRGYSFFRSFFSELGMTVTGGGRPNTLCAILFAITLTLAGVGLVLFFVAAPHLFPRPRAARVLSLAGSAFGVITGLSYVGVAFTPANLARDLHFDFVLTAFRAFLVVVIFYSAAILLRTGYPKAYAVAYALFAVLLAAYLWLITRGPGLDTLEGVMIQATGQKIIVYAAIVCMFIQSVGALRLAREEGTAQGKREARKAAESYASETHDVARET